MPTYNQIADNLMELREDWRNKIRLADELVEALRDAEPMLAHDHIPKYYKMPVLDKVREVLIKVQQ